MKLKMTVDDASIHAEDWSRGITLHEDSQGWRVVCMLLAEEVRAQRKDADRYRWLRDRMAAEDVPEEHPFWSTPSEHESAAFDAAVDARMKGAKEIE